MPIGVRTPLDVQLRHGLLAKVRRRARRLWPKGTAAHTSPGLWTVSSASTKHGLLNHVGVLKWNFPMENMELPFVML